LVSNACSTVPSKSSSFKKLSAILFALFRASVFNAKTSLKVIFANIRLATYAILFANLSQAVLLLSLFISACPTKYPAVSLLGYAPKFLFSNSSPKILLITSEFNNYSNRCTNLDSPKEPIIKCPASSANTPPTFLPSLMAIKAYRPFTTLSDSNVLYLPSNCE
jgi:hypothetical protein